jgi:hypothetical protein
MPSRVEQAWWARRGGIIVAAAVVAAGAWQLHHWWNRPPAVEFDNLKYIQLLTTAVSARNTDWIEKVERAVEDRHSRGEMSDRELQAFRRILAMAAAHEWKRAEVDCYRLAQAQLSRRRTRPPTSSREHEHAEQKETARGMAN